MYQVRTAVENQPFCSSIEMVFTCLLIERTETFEIGLSNTLKIYLKMDNVNFNLNDSCSNKKIPLKYTNTF